ncbi:MAG TPA: SDR family oxidoreductase [Phycisphaerae bacterium]|jgi:NAD(P)-dependent dehydrogenase (short-subunit alcohol dehydrogenase family)|nr:SDR family oxidoreductase [Phycisphaerae bacterium]
MSYSGFDISNLSVLVTGGTSGIGRAIALGCAQAGAKVIAGSTNPDKVAAIKKELAGVAGEHAGAHDAVAINVADEASVKAAFEFAVKKFGRLDAVVHAAGVIKRQPSLEMPVEEFRRIIDINLTGTFIVNQAAGRIMKAQAPNSRGERGCIVNIASLNSYISLTEVLAYASSKSGCLGIIRGLANEWAQHGIRVNGIAPGVFPTDLNRKLIEGTPRGEFLKAHTPQGRFGQADELVGAAIYLMSPSASYTNGHTVIVDGGFLTRGVGI